MVESGSSRCKGEDTKTDVNTTRLQLLLTPGLPLCFRNLVPHHL